LLWKEFKLLSFDAAFAASLGFPARGLDMLLTTLLVIAIVVGLQAVGVVLMSAMLIAPAVAARQWTDRLGWMVTLAAFFGALAGVAGAVTSSYVPRLSTGPAIVLAICGVVFLSLFLAPNRGILWSWLRQQHNRRQVRLDTTLLDLYALSAQHTDSGHTHTTGALQALRPYAGNARRSLQILAERGLVQSGSQNAWALTPAGVRTAKELLASGSRADEIDLSQRTVEVGL
jgi:manganese/zinc/iron transport system permease protein